MKTLRLFLLLLSPVILYSQEKGYVEPSKLPEVFPHPLFEYAFDKPADTAKWAEMPSGLHASFGSIDDIYYRREVPSLELSLEWSSTAWRGERVSAIIVLWTKDTINQVRLKKSELRNKNGHSISTDNIRLKFVRYVISNYPYESHDSEGSLSNVTGTWLLPDVLENIERMDLPGTTARPVWLSVDIPHNTVPGLYEGKIAVEAEGGINIPLTLKLEVQNATVPEPNDWKFRLDLWQNPWVLAWHNNLELWSEPHKQLLKSHLKLLADAGGKFITTYAIHSPWMDNSYRIEDTMIEWVKKADDTWSFDYTIFDEYVDLAMECGITDAITLYTMIPWKYRVRYIDEKTGDYTWDYWPPESRKFKEFWHLFLDDFRQHLEEKGWFEKTYIGINENPLKDTKATIEVLKSHSPDWKITYAGHWHPELDSLIDDYCSIIDRTPEKDEVRNRKQNGFTSTFYVCTHPNRPNNFTFSPSAENTWMGWMAAAYGYNGFLRWAYDAWTADPLRDTRHTLWPAGDCFLVYPGAKSSIRYERLREGIVDYEKIMILQETLKKKKDTQSKKSLKELEEVLTRFTYETVLEEKARYPVNEGKELLNRLTREIFPSGK